MGGMILLPVLLVQFEVYGDSVYLKTGCYWSRLFHFFLVLNVVCFAIEVIEKIVEEDGIRQSEVKWPLWVPTVVEKQLERM